MKNVMSNPASNEVAMPSNQDIEEWQTIVADDHLFWLEFELLCFRKESIDDEMSKSLLRQIREYVEVYNKHIVSDSARNLILFGDGEFVYNQLVRRIADLLRFARLDHLFSRFAFERSCDVAQWLLHLNFFKVGVAGYSSDAIILLISQLAADLDDEVVFKSLKKWHTILKNATPLIGFDIADGFSSPAAKQPLLTSVSGQPKLIESESGKDIDDSNPCTLDELLFLAKRRDLPWQNLKIPALREALRDLQIKPIDDDGPGRSKKQTFDYREASAALNEKYKSRKKKKESKKLS